MQDYAFLYRINNLLIVINAFCAHASTKLFFPFNLESRIRTSVANVGPTGGKQYRVLCVKISKAG